MLQMQRTPASAWMCNRSSLRQLMPSGVLALDSQARSAMLDPEAYCIHNGLFREKFCAM